MTQLRCALCDSPLTRDSLGTLVDDTGGDVCGVASASSDGENLPHIDLTACPVCGGKLVIDADDVIYCEANSDHWRSDTQAEGHAARQTPVIGDDEPSAGEST